MHPLLPRYVAGADCLHRAVHGLTHAELVAPPPAGPNMGTWSIKQVVVHMWHSDLAATHRMCRIASEDKPLLIAYDETAFANSLHYNELDTQTVCELFRLNRLHTASMLERLPAAAFERAGVHNHRGLITLGEMIKMYVDHVDGHMGFIARKRAAIGK